MTDKQIDYLDKSVSYYDILGVSNDASSAEIKRAYRKLAIQYHPDKQIGKSDTEVDLAEKIMARINKVFSTLMDEDNRAYYDENGEEDVTSRKYTTKENSPIFDEIFKTVKMPEIETPYTALEHIALKPTEVIKGTSRVITVNDYENDTSVEVTVNIPSGVRNGMILTYYDIVKFDNRNIKSNLSIAVTVKQSKKLYLDNEDIIIKCKKDTASGAKSIVLAGDKIELDGSYIQEGSKFIYPNMGLINILTKERGNLVLEEA